MAKKALLLGAVVLLLWAFCSAGADGEKRFSSRFRPLVTKESRRRVVATESGTITAVDVRDGCAGAYHLQFITLEPSSLFLPVLLHSDIVFYVHTGGGRVSYLQEDYKHGTQSIDVERGDVYRLEQGSVFYVESNPSPTREKLRIHAIFNTINIENPSELFFGAYSNLCDLVRGFDEQVLQMGFGVSKEVIQGIISAKRPPSIVPYCKNETEKPTWKEGIIEALLGVRGPRGVPNKKKKTKTFNFFSGKPDVENCYGWSTAVTNKGLKALKGSNLGAFMVNLTTGAMMGPHWNPKATEIAIVIQGQGMVQVVCPTNPSGESNESCECKNTYFRVKEGDVFIATRFHPMTQISFNNDSFVFVGFSTNVGENHPQFLAGKRSVLQVINKEILAMSFNAPNSTFVEELLASQSESIILSCTSCAEDLAKRTKAEEEEEREREEEEAKKREEEEAGRREKEEEARRREEEEAKRREEEEEARRREEEEAKRREEEEAKRREEEEARHKEEEEERKREEEEEAKKREEEEAGRREKEEEARRREEEEAKRKEEDEAKRREEEEARHKEEEEERKREEEEEAARRSEEKQGEKEREGEGEHWRGRREEEGAKEEEGGGEAPWEEGGEVEMVRRKVAAKKM